MRKTLVVLGIGALVAGLAPNAYAQTTSSSSNDDSVTMSGASLQIEGRTVSGDYQNFFTGTSQQSQSNSATNIGRLRRSPQRSPLDSVLNNDQVDVVFGDTLDSQDEFTSAPGDQGDTDRVKLQFQLGQ